ncbi:type VI secretion system baseplate subunit TssG [Salmonella enterica subsp. enterica]|nr:type VI secretion system baseplate subunit TssG [Salmonella enterica subsp. enterica]
MLGNGALIGEPYRICGKFRLSIVARSRGRIACVFCPAANLPVLTELVRTFIGFEYCWEIELQLKPHAAAVIGGTAAAWL